MGAPIKILFCSSGKTYGHFLRIHALYQAVKHDFRCLEIANPTKFVLPFSFPEQIITKYMYFANDYFTSYESLAENIKKLNNLLNIHRPNLVIGDKLPNLMTSCFQLKIPYISLSHAIQITYNWQNLSNPNLVLFGRYWSENSLVKPVSDNSWFFYRNWGNLIVFTDYPVADTENLEKSGYRFRFIGPIPPSIGDDRDHVGKIRRFFNRNNSNLIVLVAFSSYASKETDNLVVNLARQFPRTTFIYPRNDGGHFLDLIKEENFRNIYSPDFIDTDLAKLLANLVICLPGAGTLSSLSDYKGKILGFYVHPEQAANAANYSSDNFSFHKLDEKSPAICADLIEGALKITNFPKIDKAMDNGAALRKKFLPIISEFIPAKD